MSCGGSTAVQSRRPTQSCSVRHVCRRQIQSIVPNNARSCISLTNIMQTRLELKLFLHCSTAASRWSNLGPRAVVGRVRTGNSRQSPAVSGIPAVFTVLVSFYLRSRSISERLLQHTLSLTVQSGWFAKPDGRCGVRQVVTPGGRFHNLAWPVSLAFLSGLEADTLITDQFTTHRTLPTVVTCTGELLT